MQRYLYASIHQLHGVKYGFIAKWIMLGGHNKAGGRSAIFVARDGDA